jgi:uncharacterized caspase-like protein
VSTFPTRLRVLPLLLVVGALAWPGAVRGQEKKAGQKYALVVGVRNYKKDELRSLLSADRDATALAELLKKAGYRKVVLMTYETSARSIGLLPTSRTIKEQLAALVEGRTKDDTVLFAFFGHGAQPEGAGDYSLCPLDAELGEPKTLLPLADVYRELGRCAAGHKLAILDSGFLAPQGGESEARLLARPRPQEQAVPRGVLALFSADAGQVSYESAALKQGLFAHYLLEELQGKEGAPGGEAVRLSELVRNVRADVRLKAKDENGPRARQAPRLVGDVAAAEGLVLLVRPPRPKSAEDKDDPE